jgi:hypothetical protein
MFIVELHRLPRPKSGRDNFDCPVSLWEELKDLGMAFGWVPAGAMRMDSVIQGDRDYDYRPGDYGTPMPIVEATDAAAWAEALERGCFYLNELKVDLPPRGPLVLNVGEHEGLNTLANGGLTRDFAAEFRAYLQRGAFDFAWDD